jgi:hypothetical protein
MWQLIKYEIYYNWYYLILITVLFLTYTVLSLFDIQLTDSPEFMIDYWGGIFSLVVYVFLFSTWGSRVKEKRIRFHSLLPLSQQHNSYSRFWLAGLPFFAIIAYLVFFGQSDLNKGLVGFFSSKSFQYAKLIFSPLGLIILATTIFSLRKRRSYLS